MSSGSERSGTLFKLWRRVNELAAIEDAKTIRLLIAEAGIEPGVHVGVDPKDFTPPMAAEWVLGQWAEMIDAGSPFLNSVRNISFSQYEKVVGPMDVKVHDRDWHVVEIKQIAGRLGGDVRGTDDG